MMARRGFKNRETAVEAGRLGGNACLRRYGLDHYRMLGKRGGDSTAGRIGGNACLAKYGSDYYAEIGRLGGKARAREAEDSK